MQSLLRHLRDESRLILTAGGAAAAVYGIAVLIGGAPVPGHAPHAHLDAGGESVVHVAAPPSSAIDRVAPRAGGKKAGIARSGNAQTASRSAPGRPSKLHSVEEVSPLRLQPLDVIAVFVQSPRGRVEPARLQDVDVGGVDARHRGGDGRALFPAASPGTERFPTGAQGTAAASASAARSIEPARLPARSASPGGQAAAGPTDCGVRRDARARAYATGPAAPRGPEPRLDIRPGRIRQSVEPVSAAPRRASLLRWSYRRRTYP